MSNHATKNKSRAREAHASLLLLICKNGDRQGYCGPGVGKLNEKMVKDLRNPELCKDLMRIIIREGDLNSAYEFHCTSVQERNNALIHSCTSMESHQYWSYQTKSEVIILIAS